MGSNWVDICNTRKFLHKALLANLSLIVLALQSPITEAETPVYLGYHCPVDGYSYSVGSAFEENLNASLTTYLVANATSEAFSSITTGEGIDTVYALYYCRGDVGVKACHGCVLRAATRIRTLCKLLKQGIAWYEECTLRYANHTIFSLDDDDLKISYPKYNTTTVVGDYLDQYREIFDSSMRKLVDQVASNDAKVGFGTAQVKLTPAQTLLGMAQCAAPIITGSSCLRCLTAALKQMNLWANTMVYLPACFVGFEIYGLPPSPPPLPSSPSSSSLKVHYKILIPILCAVAILSLIGGFCLWKRRSYSKGDPHPPPVEKHKELTSWESNDTAIADNPEQNVNETGRQRRLAQFTFSQVQDITNGFEHQIGEGGYAVVYHGCLPDDTNREVAVKVFSKKDAPIQFSIEVDVLGRIAHKNLVSLIGYCEEGTNLALIYEYMDMGDLKALLSDHSKTSNTLSWSMRIEIALDTAQGLDYLHNGCSPPIIHRDVKPANILLNKDFRAKVADFGFSKIFPIEYVSHLHSRVVGTLGYLDPQYNLTGNVNEKGDVYSFGVVLLELITGKTAIINRVVNLGEWVRHVLETGDIASVLDSTLREEVDDNYLSVWKTVELATRCIQLDATQRPTMSQIVIELKECLAMMNEAGSTYGKDSQEVMSAAFSTSYMAPRPR